VLKNGVTLILLAALIAGSPGKSAARVPDQEAEHSAQSVRQALIETGVPSVSLAQIRHGRVVRIEAFGTQDGKVPATPATLYNIASLTKPLTAEIVLRLASRGKISLDEPMDRDWIDPDLASDPRHTLLSARLALTHQTGLPNWRATTGLSFMQDPGKTWSYSGEGFQYVARFVERRTHETLDRLAVRYLFNPLRMKETSYVSQPWFEGRIAVPHDAVGKPLTPTLTERANAADLVYTTPRD
jgi:CubicO group peptidase (beta-lactamase class C family)